MSFIFIVSMLFKGCWMGRVGPKVGLSILPLLVLKADKEKEGLDTFYKLLDELGLSIEDERALRTKDPQKKGEVLLKFVAVVLTKDFVKKQLGDKTGALDGAVGARLLLTEREYGVLMSMKVNPENPYSYPDRFMELSEKRISNERFLRAAGFTKRKLNKVFANLQ